MCNVTSITKHSNSLAYPGQSKLWPLVVANWLLCVFVYVSHVLVLVGIRFGFAAGCFMMLVWVMRGVVCGVAMAREVHAPR